MELGKRDESKSLLFAVTTKRNLDGGVISQALDDTVIKSLRKNNQLNLMFDGAKLSLALLTQRLDCYSHQGPALVLYPDKKLLDKIDDLSGVTEVLVVPWLYSDIQNWIKTWNARDLESNADQPSEPVFSDPVLEEALKSLTNNVNVSTGIGHPSDKEFAVGMFRKLKQAGIDYDPAEIRDWLVRNGWRSENADDVKDVAEKIKQGKIVRGGRKMWRDDIVQQWRERSSKS